MNKMNTVIITAVSGGHCCL